MSARVRHHAMPPVVHASQVRCVGHSLGGAMATLCALELTRQAWHRTAHGSFF